MDGRGDSPSRPIAIRASARHGRRLAEYVLIAGIFCGSMALWVAVPLGSLWLASQVSDRASTVMLTVLIVCPVAMLASGLLLAAVYRAYLRAHGTAPAPGRSAWLGSLSGERRPHRPRAVLDTCMTISASTAIVLLLVWFFFLAENHDPAGLLP